ncbi:MAG: penicillin-binding protein 1C, partial [Paracoccaceae bacterium]
MPDLNPAVSATVLDRDGRLLRAYQVSDGRWRLPVKTADVDANYIAQLLAYEDRRFRAHSGVDVLALVRATGQAAWHGRPVSGASTLTMQVARLLTETPTRSIVAKLAQIRLALALERELTKDEILGLYLTLAPFGGNIEGVRAASLSWFGKEPRRLTPAEAALLVALPQSPNTRRPDRAAKAARGARSRVLARAVRFGALSAEDAEAAGREPLPNRRRAFPQLAPHLADREARPGEAVTLTISRDLQSALEGLLSARVLDMAPAQSAAIIVADHRTGEILAQVGSPGLDYPSRQGFVDMTSAVRSPGSTLKPLIYGLAFEDGIAHPESLIEDRPMAFGAYTPTNFDEAYSGTVSVRAALQRSLNVPAVALLEAVGPAALMTRLRRAGARPALPPGQRTSLAIALGGVGVRLTGLVQVFAGIAAGGKARPLHVHPAASKVPVRMLSDGAAWQVADVLAGAPAPMAASNGQLAYKTGTSYGHRDAWAIGFDGAHVIGIWTGRPDATPVPGITGIRDAAPLLFEAFARLKRVPTPLAPPPADVLIVGHAELPGPLKQVRAARRSSGVPEPEIAFP